MKKFLAILVLGAIIIAGYNFYNENKKTKKAIAICEDFYKTSDERCINEYWNYHHITTEKAAKKNWPEYKKKVDEILKKVDDLSNKKPNINLLEYSYASALAINNYRINKKQMKDKKIIIADHIWSGDIFYARCYSRYDYSVCMQQSVYNEDGDDIERQTEVQISNIDDFPNVKKIIDELSSYNFSSYRKTVYGILDGKSDYDAKINADFIKFERLELKDKYYENQLRSGLFGIKREEFLEYMKENYPKSK